MFTAAEFASMAVFLLVFLGIYGVGAFLFWRAYDDERRTMSRLRELSENYANQSRASLADFALGAIPKIGTLMLPGREEDLSGLKGKLLRAGLYSPNAVRVFLGVKLTLIVVLPLVFALVPWAVGVLGLLWAMVASCVASAAGVLLPSLWLEQRAAARQRELRAGLPDGLDMLVLCLEGGLSLTAALQRITGELKEVHPALGEELGIVEQTIKLGLSAGEGIKKFGDRSGLEEMRDLAAVLLQSERYGASVTKALRTYADQFRDERQQKAEEMAQKAAVKILFPMLLFIFPAVFVVLLGPAAFQIAHLFAK